MIDTAGNFGRQAEMDAGKVGDRTSLSEIKTWEFVIRLEGALHLFPSFYFRHMPQK